MISEAFRSSLEASNMPSREKTRSPIGWPTSKLKLVDELWGGSKDLFERSRGLG